MGSGTRQSVKAFQDMCVIHCAYDNDCYVADGLHTHQIGLYDCPVNAICSLLRAVDFLLDDAARDSRRAVFREPPEEVQELLVRATRLPNYRVFDIACETVHGHWPEAPPKIGG